MDENFKVGNFICELRREKGITQVELGARLNVTNKAVSRWENGRGLPDSSLLLPLAEILGVTVDEILRGELKTTVISVNDESEVKEDQIEIANNTIAYRGAKKLLIRDSFIVLPILLFTVAFFMLKIVFGVDFAPGANYYWSMMCNLIIPIFIIGAGQLVYAVVLIGDTLKLDGRSALAKGLLTVGIWFAVNNLYLFVYIRRIVVYLKCIKKCDSK